MTDRGKTVKGLEIHADRSDRTDCDDCPYSKDEFSKGGCIGQLCSDALALLKEQEAKPVVVTINSYGTKFYHCPKCNRDLYAYPRQRYCSQCGQAVKWE